MNSTSPANSSISTTAIVGGGGGGGGGGGSSSNNTVIDDFHFPSDLISIQDRKDEAMLVLKSDLLAALNKEVKSMDEDNWMFEGPRSRINLISKGGGLLKKQMETTKNPNLAPPSK
ncbi:protein SAMBA-like [Pistacia vera]|uniref:protein SAMBA-like n=1 Tax=Pistacia vera TaxID=55513 RepID=UPI001262DFE8|nr:protein SAMBA-like [Pistacia vera]XP_031248837.1 protein SAMBA-like [Pistacia vera]